MESKYWHTKQSVIQKLGKEQDVFVVAGDAEVDARLEVCLPLHVYLEVIIINIIINFIINTSMITVIIIILFTFQLLIYYRPGITLPTQGGIY